MNNTLHRILISLYFIVVIVCFLTLTYVGESFYKLPIEERYFHPYYEWLKPSGLVGHGLGILGSSLIVLGIFGYMARKRLKIFSGIGVLKYWLEFHIFLCTLGSVLVLFHTSFKFGGIISVGFWSLAIVWVSGVIGRYIYLQIPRTIEGRELSLHELQDLKDQLDIELYNKYNIDFSSIKSTRFSLIKLQLLSNNISKNDFLKVKLLIRKQKRLLSRIKRLDKMKKLFKYWHVAHLPFALIMLIIMLIHISVVLYFGYKWIF